MASDAVLNIRLPQELKRHGNQVLQRHGISVSQAVRKLYEYMEASQEVPAFLADVADDDMYRKRRAVLRKAAGDLQLPEDFDERKILEERILSKYGEGL